MSLAAALPPEILADIFRLARPSPSPASAANLPHTSLQLRTLALVCTAWHAVAHRLLYRAALVKSERHARLLFDSLAGTSQAQTGAHLRLVRLDRVPAASVVPRLARLAPNLQELYMKQADLVWTDLSGNERLEKLVLWAVDLDGRAEDVTDLPVLPSLVELSLCGISGHVPEPPWFTRRSLPRIERIACIYARTRLDENLFTHLPVDVRIVSNSNLRRSLGPAAASTIVVTNRLTSLLEGWTTIDSDDELCIRHLSLTDTTPSSLRRLPEFFDASRTLASSLETLWIAGGCPTKEIERELRAWCGKSGVRYEQIDETDFMTESSFPREIADYFADRD
ncbi:hypothetical protein JCM10212_002728 [Sporobolomyces blumeae]